MRLFRVPGLLLSLLTLSPTARANGGSAAILLGTLCVIGWNTHAKPAGAYVGAVPPEIPDVIVHTAQQTATGPSTTASAPVSAGPKIEGKLALRLKQSLMLDARAKLQTIPDYLATFSRQERVNGKLLTKESTALKVRHAPFSVYMKWTDGADVGREILYVKGEHDGRMLVKPGGKLGEALPTIKLDPEGDLALKSSRYPLTQSGILNLVEKIITYGDRDLKLEQGVACQFLPDQKIDGRMCHAIRTDYGCAEVDADYRSSIIFIDVESSIPLCVKNYGWSEKCGAPPSANDRLTEDTLVEFYAFTGLRYQSRLDTKAFDQANAEYRFRRH